MNANESEHAVPSTPPSGGASVPRPGAVQVEAAAPWVPPALFWPNVALWLAAGVFFSGWLLRYTDKFEVFGGLLALGGAASWLAFAMKILPEDRLKLLQVQFCDKIFVHKNSMYAALGCLVLTLLLFIGRGSIQVESYSQIGGDVWIYPIRATPESVDPIPLLPNGRFRSTRWAPIWTKTDYRVRVSGLPITKVTFLPCQRRATLQVPYSYRPCVLVGVSGRVFGIIQDGHRVHNRKYGMTVTVDEKDYRVEDYEGDFVLVGGSLPMDVPSHIRREWANELENSDLAAKLLSPRLVEGFTSLARRGSAVTIKIYEDGWSNVILGAGPVAVRPVLEVEDIVQPLLIE